MAASITSYFHKSGIRTKELKKIAVKKELNIDKFPEFFEVRQTVFSLKLSNSILKSWHVTIIYSQNCKQTDAKS